MNKNFISFAKEGNLEKIVELYENGANIHAENDEAFINACLNGHCEVAKYLIEKGADINAQHQKAIFLSTKYEIIYLLYENGANIHLSNDHIFRWSAQCGYFENVRFLYEKGANIHAENDYALRWASRTNHLNIVIFLVDNGADIHVKNDQPLRWASEEGQYDIVKFLVERGANISAKNNDALRMSAQNGHYRTLKFLVQNGADVHADHDFAIRMASSFGKLLNVRFLFDIVTDVNVRNESLRLACENNQTDVVKFFLKKGLDSNLLNERMKKKLGLIPIDWKPKPQNIKPFRPSQECPISGIEFTDEIPKLGCGKCLNVFEKTFLEKWLKVKDICPFCRKKSNFYCA